MSWRNLLIYAVMVCATASAREWHSADGTRTLEAQFAGMKEDKLLLKDKDGKATIYPAAVFSKEDQQFAQQAQVVLDAAVSVGALDMQVDQLLPEGYVCRIIKKQPVEKETWIATGAPFLVLRSNEFATELNARVMGKRLFHAGTRTVQALDGKSTLMNAYSVSLDEAVDASLRIAQAGDAEAAKIQEPSDKLIILRGLVLPLGNKYFIAEAAQLKNAKTMTMHFNGKDVQANVLQSSEPLDVALLTSDIETGPKRLLPSKPVEPGQKIFAVSLMLASDGKTYATATRTAGRISRLIGSDIFEHDAAIPENSKGGYVLDEKGDLLGIFFSGQSRMLGSRPTQPTASTDQPVVAGLSDSIRIASLEKLLPDSVQQTPGVPWAKPAVNSEPILMAAEVLRKTSLVIVTTSEDGSTTPKAADAKPPAAGGGGPVTGWSLSSSGTRHNNNCRYFKPQAPCKATDGTPCKICGG